MDGNPVEFQVVRRAKSVASRVVGAEELAMREAPVRIVEVDAGVGAIDPTQYGQLRRKRGHARVYRMARVMVVIGAACSVAALLCVILGDRTAGLVLAVCGVAGALASVGLSWETRLTQRVLGYAVGGMVLAAVALGVVLAAPAAWFSDEPATGELQYKAPKRAAPLPLE